MLPLGIMFAGAGFYLGARSIAKRGRLALTAVVFAALYAWLDGVWFGFNLPVYLQTFVRALLVAVIAFFFLDRYEEELAKWFGIYVVAILALLFFA